MLTKTSCQLGVNLARMLQHHGKDLTPVKGSLLDELSIASYLPDPQVRNAEYTPSDEQLAFYVSDSTQGAYSDAASGQKTYQPSRHDCLMDNYIETLSSLVAQQVVFSRSVVYPKIQYFADQVSQTLATCTVKQPEDFFTVKMYCLPEAVSLRLIEDEVMNFTPSSAANTAINFKQDVYKDFDLSSYLKTDDLDFDNAASAWYNASDKNKLFGYVFSNKPVLEAALSVNELIDYSLTNFLFYRSLCLKKDMQTDLSVVELTIRATNNRDYYARALKAAVQAYSQLVRQGVVLSSDSQTNFSYLGDTCVCITVYQETMAQAAANGSSIEQIFGFISQFSSTALKVEMLKTEGNNYLRAWERVRGLYLAYINSQRDTLFKMALKRNFAQMLDEESTDEDKEFFNAHPGYKAKSLELANEYIDKLTLGSLEQTQQVYIDLIARIAYRDSAASFIIPEMSRLLGKDQQIEPQHAALISTVKYVTSYLIDQASLTR